jgi:hypothetical protein
VYFEIFLLTDGTESSALNTNRVTTAKFVGQCEDMEFEKVVSDTCFPNETQEAKCLGGSFSDENST